MRAVLGVEVRGLGLRVGVGLGIMVSEVRLRLGLFLSQKFYIFSDLPTPKHVRRPLCSDTPPQRL